MILRRLRAAAILAVTWGVLWAPFGVALYLGLGMSVGDMPLTWRDAWHLAGLGAAVAGSWGVVSGGLFALALATAERRGSIDRLRRWRVVLWGAIGGAAFPAAVTTVLVAGMGNFNPGKVLLLITSSAVGAVYGAIVAALLLAAARGQSPGEAA